MPANYVMIRDSGVTLPLSDGDLDVELTFDADGIRNDRSVVLWYRVAPGSPAGEITFTMNGDEVIRTDFGSGVERDFHEVIGAGVVKPSGNTLKLKLTNDSGSLTVSDIVLFYKQP